MNKETTIRLLQEQHFMNLTEVGQDVIRVERVHETRPIAIFYFDFTQRVTNPDFDLQAYLKQRIASDFYRREGSLQWNYYLNFVLEKAAFLRFHATPKAAAIEADRTFARKRIWEQEALNADIAHPLATMLQRTKPSQDIASRWVEALTNAGLKRIAEPAAEYAKIVRDYLSGESKPPVSTSGGTTAPVADGRFIRRLRCDNFRTHPTQRNFEFATVNLFRGVNGTGKTSLLESVELSICGGNRRQEGKAPFGAKLLVEFVGQNQPERFPGTNAAWYRARDLAWYGGYYRTGNRLFENFGRFNFFDSDAAFQLSSSTSGEGILRAINTLLLGKSATIIEERMHQCRERFAREERTLTQRVLDCRREVTRISQQIEELKAIKDTREALLRELQVKAVACRWQKLPARFRLDDLAVLHEKVEHNAAELVQHAGRLIWLSRVSVASLSNEAKRLGESLNELARQKELAGKNSTAWERTKARVVEVEAELKVLRRLREYHGEPEAMSLLGIGEAIKQTKMKVAQFKEVVTLLRPVDLKNFEDVTATLEEITARQDADIAKGRRQLAKLKARAAELQTQLGAIKTVVEQIKGLGHRFCELSPNTTDCPLCGAHYDQLSARIASPEFGVPTESSLRDLTSEVAREQSTLTESQKTADVLSQLRRAAQVIFAPAQLASRTTQSVVETLVSSGEKLTEARAKLDELTAKQKRLKLAGFEEEELDSLLKEGQEAHSHARSKLAKRDAVQALANEKAGALAALQTDDRDKEKAQREIDVEVRRLVGRLLEDASVKDPGVELERRKTLVEEVLAEIRGIQKEVAVSDSESFSTLANRLDTFAKVINRIQEALKRVEERDVLEQSLSTKLTEIQTELAKLTPSSSRAKTALTLLDDLLGSDYKKAYQLQVVTEHRDKLSTIFSRIHAPHEFKDVNIDPNVLLERHSGAKSKVSEISTGQRAALALSIFLSLNSGVTARAPWLLFDEPVAHVDDLNILSFLDMLRDLVLLRDRQVFFATANTRIADLFARKFDCLGTGFREFVFQR